MGLSYRKSVKMGPFRVTASKSGISYSTGVKGARITKRADGKVQTTLSAPGTGLRYTKTAQGKSRTATPAAAKRAPQPAKATVRTPQLAAAKQAPVAKPPQAAKPAPASRPVRPPKPPPAPKPARPPKALKLRGQRSTTPPRIPPASRLPLTMKGNLATVTLHQAGIHIERTRAGRIGGSHSADISWHELAGIDFLAPGLFRNGHVHFATFNDPRGLTFAGNGNPMTSSARNPHVILFDWPKSRAYNQLRDLLTGSVYRPPPPHPPQAWQPPSQPPTWHQQPAWQPPTWQPPVWPPGNYPPQGQPRV